MLLRPLIWFTPTPHTLASFSDVGFTVCLSKTRFCNDLILFSPEIFIYFSESITPQPHDSPSSFTWIFTVPPLGPTERNRNTKDPIRCVLIDNFCQSQAVHKNVVFPHPSGVLSPPNRCVFVHKWKFVYPIQYIFGTSCSWRWSGNCEHTQRGWI